MNWSYLDKVLHDQREISQEIKEMYARLGLDEPAEWTSPRMRNEKKVHDLEAIRQWNAAVDEKRRAKGKK